MSISTGAIALAEAGLQSGRRATTHWAVPAELARRSSGVKVNAGALHVGEGKVFASAVAASLARVAVMASTSTALHTSPNRYRQKFRQPDGP